ESSRPGAPAARYKRKTFRRQSGVRTEKGRTGRMASLTVGRFSGIRSAMVRQARPAPGWALMQQLTANGWQWWLAEMECGEAGLLRSRLTRQRLTLAGLWARRIVTITYQKTTL